MLAGLVLGAFVGGLLLVVGGGLVDALGGRVSPAVALWMLRAASLTGAVRFAARGPRIAWRSRASSRSRVGAHGWVDLVVRVGLGACCGLLGGFLVWWTARVWLPVSWFARGLGEVALFVAASGGIGALWFACDLPWFASRRAVAPSS